MAKSLLPLGGFRCVGRSARPLLACPAAMLFQMRHPEAHCRELWMRRLARPGRGRQDMFLLDYLPPAGPGRQPLRPFQRLPRRQVQRDRHGAGDGGAGCAVAPPQVAQCARHRAPPCAACAQRGAEHCCRRAHKGHRMDAAQAHVAARALRAWLQPAPPAGAGPAVASQPARDPPRGRKRSRSRSSSPERATRRARPASRECARHPGEPSDPPPRVSMGGAHSLSGSGMLDGWGELRRPLPLPPPPHSPRGGRQGRGGQQGVGHRCRKSRQVARAAAITGGGGALPPPPSTSPPSSSQGLADIFGNISRQLTVARAGVPPPGLGTGRPPGVADSSSGGGGGGRRSRQTPTPQGTAPGGAVAATSAARAGKAPPFRGSHRASGRVPAPLPPTEEGAAGRGKRVGQPRRPMQTLCDEHRAPSCKSCRGHRGVRHCCSRHHEGHPRVLGGGQRFLPVQRWGLQPQAGVLPSGGPALVPGPVTGGEGGDLAGQGTAASPRGGTQGPDQGHGRASEEGT